MKTIFTFLQGASFHVEASGFIVLNAYKKPVSLLSQEEYLWVLEKINKKFDEIEYQKLPPNIRKMLISVCPIKLNDLSGIGALLVKEGWMRVDDDIEESSPEDFDFSLSLVEDYFYVHAGQCENPSLYFKKISLLESRYRFFLSHVPENSASLFELGCGTGELLKKIKRMFKGSIFGIDLLVAGDSELIKGNFLTNLSWMDSETLLLHEVIEHLHDDEIRKLTSLLIDSKAHMIMLTTPNIAFNCLYTPSTGFRHFDHKFEWDKTGMLSWANELSCCFSFSDFDIGPTVESIGSASMGLILKRK